MKLPAIVLAAGRGTRMGRNKALIELGGRSFLETVLANLQKSPVVGEVIVVTGADGHAVGLRARELGARVVHNEAFSEGIMTSLQAGLKSLHPATTGAVVALVDVPFFLSETVTSLVHLSRLQSSSESGMLGRACYGDHPGHPCVIGSDYFGRIFSQPSSDQGAGFLFRNNPDAYQYVCSDPGVVTDFDSPSTLESHVHGHGFYQHP